MEFFVVYTKCGSLIPCRLTSFSLMSVSRFFICPLLVLLIRPACVHAQEFQETASHTVTISIGRIAVLAVSGNPAPLIVDKTSDRESISLTDGSTFYNLTTNIENVILTAELDFEMPEGTELWITGDTSLGQSHGRIRLTGTGGNSSMVTQISRGLENGRVLTYEFVAGESAVAVPFQSRQVTISLLDSQTGKEHKVVQTVFFSVSSGSYLEATN